MSTQQKLLKGVLFDLDGVLINSLTVMKMALGAALKEVYPKRELDLDVLFIEYRQYLGMGFPQIMQNMNFSSKVHEPFRKHSRYLARYINLYPGVIDLLEQCTQHGLVLGIATGKDLQRTQELLMQLRIQQYFSQILTSDTVAQPKPAPDMVLDFCSQQSLQTDEVLFIGDAKADINCGQSAGCLTAAATWGYSNYEALLLLSPDFFYSSASDAARQLIGLTNSFSINKTGLGG